MTDINEDLPNVIPKTPLAKAVRTRLSMGACRLDGKFYPNQPVLKLIADIEALEIECNNLREENRKYDTERDVLEQEIEDGKTDIIELKEEIKELKNIQSYSSSEQT